MSKNCINLYGFVFIIFELINFNHKNCIKLLVMHEKLLIHFSNEMFVFLSLQHISFLSSISNNFPYINPKCLVCFLIWSLLIILFVVIQIFRKTRSSTFVSFKFWCGHQRTLLSYSYLLIWTLCVQYTFLYIAQIIFIV